MLNLIVGLLVLLFSVSFVIFLGGITTPIYRYFDIVTSRRLSLLDLYLIGTLTIVLLLLLGFVGFVFWCVGGETVELLNQYIL